jgi:hypothetical protein
MKPPKGKAHDALMQFMDQHPDASLEEIIAYMKGAIANDESIRDAMVEELVIMAVEEVYDEAAREDREIPEYLKKPN